MRTSAAETISKLTASPRRSHPGEINFNKYTHSKRQRERERKICSALLFISLSEAKRLSRALCLVKNNAPRSARLNTHSKLFSRSSDKKESSAAEENLSRRVRRDYRLLFFSRVHISSAAAAYSVALFFVSYHILRRHTPDLDESARLDTCYSFEVRDCSLSAFFCTPLVKEMTLTCANVRRGRSNLPFMRMCFICYVFNSERGKNCNFISCESAL